MTSWQFRSKPLIMGYPLLKSPKGKPHRHNPHNPYPQFRGFRRFVFNNQACRIQVKSRYATDFDGGFPINNFDCDFLVFVALNRGYRYAKAHKESGDTGITPPVFFVFPAEVIQSATKQAARWQKVYLRDIADVSQYLNGWDRIAVFMTSL